MFLSFELFFAEDNYDEKVTLNQLPCYYKYTIYIYLNVLS